MSESEDDRLLELVNMQLGIVTFAAQSPANSSNVIDAGGSLFRVVGGVSSWIEAFYPGLKPGDRVQLAEVFVFLDHFIAEANERLLLDGSKETLGSGPWSERDVNDEEQSLSATASLANGVMVIQVRAIPKDLRYQQVMFQKAREYSLSYERLRKDREEKQILLHTIVHDIASPLTVIDGSLSVLASGELNKIQRDLVAGASEQTSRVSDLISDVLQVFSAEVRPFDPAATNRESAPYIQMILEKVVRSYQPVFAEQGLELLLLETKYDDIQVIAESAELFRVFVNLLENAIRYAPNGSTVTFELSVRESSAREKEVQITVADQGPGVPTELVSDLFDRFSGGREYGGKSGLGLYFCKTCVNRWGGKIEYLGNTDKCRFQVSLRCLI